MYNSSLNLFQIVIDCPKKGLIINNHNLLLLCDLIINISSLVHLKWLQNVALTSVSPFVLTH